MHGSRFCYEHRHHHARCAAFKPAAERSVGLHSGSTLASWITAYFTVDAAGIRSIVGHHCPKNASDHSLTCGDPLCRDIVQQFGRPRRIEDRLPEDTDCQPKKERERYWQIVHDMCWTGHFEFVGFFFYVCACGMLFCLKCLIWWYMFPATNACHAMRRHTYGRN